MTWLLALIFRPVGSLLLFGSAAFVAYKLLAPLIPEGRVKSVLYDRGIRKNHPWKFAVLGLVSCYGVMGLVAWFVTR